MAADARIGRRGDHSSATLSEVGSSRSVAGVRRSVRLSSSAVSASASSSSENSSPPVSRPGRGRTSCLANGDRARVWSEMGRSSGRETATPDSGYAHVSIRPSHLASSSTVAARSDMSSVWKANGSCTVCFGCTTRLAALRSSRKDGGTPGVASGCSRRHESVRGAPNGLVKLTADDCGWPSAASTSATGAAGALASGGVPTPVASYSSSPICGLEMEMVTSAGMLMADGV
mmetsp:Transcript_27679/g.89414  ORF Transcript_27679/g.89414 Transcript_27679/m.89414 type:complete len:231 (-) Transcript_27679:7947-8639(-)